MTERPIIFSSETVRAILEGRKSQTRRVIKPQPPDWTWNHRNWDDRCINVATDDDKDGYYVICPYGQPGDHLWIKETWHYLGGNNTEPSPGYVSYRADGEFIIQGYRWRPSIFMPRWASRITLEITGVRVERVQEISYDDCCRETGSPLKWEGEGEEPYHRQMHTVFAELWDRINAKRGYPWVSNPWVWVVEFTRHEGAG